MPLPAFQFSSVPEACFCQTLHVYLPLNLPYPKGKVLLSALTVPFQFVGTLEGEHKRIETLKFVYNFNSTCVIKLYFSATCFYTIILLSAFLSCFVTLKNMLHRAKFESILHINNCTDSSWNSVVHNHCMDLSRNNVVHQTPSRLKLTSVVHQP